MNLLRHVDLCSGIGGFALGFQWANLSKPIMFCDIEPWSRQILSKHWPDVPIATDVKELANDPNGLVPDCDILTAGYPCQPFSQAGQRRGSEDDRHIWPYIFSIVQRKRPSWCVFENVFGHVTLGLDEVLSDLEGEGYATRPFVVPACAVDAYHRRDRLWIICRNVENSNGGRRYTQSLFGSERSRGENDFNTNEPSQRWDSRALDNTKHDGSPTPTVKGSIGKASKHHTQGQNKTSQSQRASEPRDSGSVGESARTTDVADTQSLFSNVGREHTQQSEGQVSELGERSSEINVADTVSKRQQGSRSRRDAGNKKTHGKGKATEPINGSAGSFWEPEPRVGRVANGVSKRVDRLKGLGNAIVPQIAMRIGQTIKHIEEQDGR